MPLPRAAELLFNYPRLYRAKFALTALLLRVVRPLLFKTLVTIEDVIASARIPAGSRICEIGCGDGENFRVILRIVGNVDYTGIDINPAMIAHCQRESPDQRWLCAVPKYEFTDRQFDYCVIVNVLHHLNTDAEVAEMLVEARRISRTVVLFEPLQSENRLLYRLKELYWALTDGGHRYLRLADFHALFAQAGLQTSWERYSSPLRHFYGAHLIAGTV